MSVSALTTAAGTPSATVCASPTTATTRPPRRGSSPPQRRRRRHASGGGGFSPPERTDELWGARRGIRAVVEIGRRTLELSGIQLGERASGREQLGVRAALD